ncbi:hypothetical protein Nepgr_002353 [Nepenthes gracilis]|uniref:RING-type E3 ubiquitin transferase n=1 Tax=Nepenthes gracilis TaxID=150966 RepID=A0AAD3RXQ8_NEPGR|nr:hypothetical protein Nepgr_002353 [Nepenthes gracilis]
MVDSAIGNLEGIERIRFPEIDPSSASTSIWGEETAEQPAARGVVEDKIFVAVSKEVRESKSTLIWALQNSQGNKICIIHVHKPSQTIPILGGKFPVSSVGKQEVEAYREIEKQTMFKVLDEYVRICRQAGVQAEKLYIEMDSIEKGIVELISLQMIGKLVMGAAADSRYSRKTREPRSTKALFVRREAPAFCHIWFICKGHLICTRLGTKQSSPNDESVQSNSSKLRSMSRAEDNQTDIEFHLVCKTRSLNLGGNCDDASGWSSPRSRLDAEESSDECDQLSRDSISQSYGRSRYRKAVSSSSFSPFAGIAERIPDIGLLDLPQSDEKHCASSPPSVLERTINNDIYYQLEQAIADAEDSRREAFEESMRRRKAERDTIEAIRKAKAAEIVYSDELRLTKQIKGDLAKGKEELESIKNQSDKIFEELQNALDQRSFLENEIEKSNLMVKELEEKIVSAVELLQNYKKEREELQIERCKALCEAEELRKQLELQSLNTHFPKFFSEFSFLEIEEATNNFDRSMKIGEGGYGSIYKGLLRHIEVAVKILHPDSSQGPQEFQQEVDILSKLRHPNLVILLGACPEIWALIYEYLPNGSLEDRLNCKDNTPPLSWQTRIRIAAELCSVLIFLHLSEPHSIVHGDLKPANVLLDAHFVCKLTDFGISHVISNNEMSAGNATRFHSSNHLPMGTSAYMDPEILSNGEITPQSDVFSFGIILLRLLTGKPALGITKEVQYALDKDSLNAILDPSAGDWPFVQAKQLACLALRCCETNKRNRPELVSEVWRVIEPMRASCGSLSSIRFGAEQHGPVPSYFICPIFQEIMEDPHIAADGFTYEAEALRGMATTMALVLASGRTTLLWHISFMMNHS